MEREFANELETVNSESAMLDEIYVLTNEIKDLDSEIKSRKERLENVRARMLDYMQRNNFVKRETDKMTVTVKDAYESRSVDSDLLKKDGLYEKYCKTKTVGASIVVTLKKIKG